MPARDLKLARECGRALPRNHPLYRRKLELSAKHTALAFGHRSLLENCPLFLCLILGVHSNNVPRARRACVPRSATSFFHPPFQLGDALVEVGRVEGLGETLDDLGEP